MSGYSGTVIDTILELQNSLNERADKEQIDRWWTLVEMIESNVDSDPRASKYEREGIARIKTTVSDVYLALRENLNPNYTSANVALSGLRESIGRRTTGLDGWPLR